MLQVLIRSIVATTRTSASLPKAEGEKSKKVSFPYPHYFETASPQLQFPSHLSTIAPNQREIATATMSLKRKAASAATDATKKAKPNGSITAFFGAPKKDPNAPSSAAAAKFDKDAWVAKLTDEQKELLQLELDTLHDSWLPHLKDVLVSPQFLELKKFLKAELGSGKTVYPPMKDVYSWYVWEFCSVLEFEFECGWVC